MKPNRSGKLGPIQAVSILLVGLLLVAFFLGFVTARSGRPNDMVLIPAGPFEMGAADRPEEAGLLPSWIEENAKPKHWVTLSAFYLDRYEVTLGEYRKIRPAFNRSQALSDFPVTEVSWYEADAFCRAVGKRLPTEEEWEKAARGTDGRIYPWGNLFDRGKANLGRFPAAVGSRPGDRSPYGVMDMAGNASEWTESWYRPYPGSHYSSPELGLTHKVVRGGSFMEDRHFADELFARVTFRAGYSPADAGADTGFRCALSVDETSHP